MWKVLICQIIFESNLRNPLEWSQLLKIQENSPQLQGLEEEWIREGERLRSY